MRKKIIIWIIFFLIWLLLFFGFSNFNNDNIIDTQINYTNLVDNTNNWENISKLLTNENYEKVWINPEKYETFEGFLEDFSSFTWVLIDPINENFTIWIKKDNWNIVYIPFRFERDKVLFNDEENKNLAILDIYWSYKNDLIYWGLNSKFWNKIVFEDETQHSTSDILAKIFNVNINNESSNVNNIISSLNKSDKIWLSNNELLAYLYDFTWEYSKASEKRDEICNKYDTICNKKIYLNIIWIIKDSNWNPIEGVKIELLNNSKFSTISKKDWTYSFNFDSYPFSHLRIKSSKKWYSDWFVTYSLNNYYSVIDKKNIEYDFTLNKAHDIFTINKENKSDFKKGKYYIIKNEYSKYFVPMDGLYFLDWKKYNWDNFDVFTYQFNKDSNTDNLLENDTFEPVQWYVWNLMKTFWMPYIQFVDKDSWEELFIKSSNPMVLQNQVYHMKELYDNTDKIYEEITIEDMQFLVDKSNELWWYPIDFDFLTTNNFLRWPARWSLDRTTWIWSNVWSRVLNVDWLVELPFYHIKDN